MPVTMPANPCECGSKSFWRGKVAESSWFCVKCRPPVVASMVGETLELGTGNIHGRQKDQDELAEFRVTPMVRYYVADEDCNECRGRMLQDTVQADGSWQVRCYTCRGIKGSG